MALKIKLDAFEGPFDLLFHLIEKNQIDINDIPIAELTEQYLEYLKDIDEDQLEVASEFLVMAATLLSIKSKMLLPSRNEDEQDEIEVVSDEEIDPREELVTKLKEYKKFKAIASILDEMQAEQRAIFKRPPEDMTSWWSEEFTLSEKTTIKDLIEAFSNAMKKHPKEPKSHLVTRDPIPLTSKIRELDRLVKFQRRVYFSRLFTARSSEAELIVTFLAVLELIKVDKIRAFQQRLFGEIVMEYRGDIK